MRHALLLTVLTSLTVSCQSQIPATSIPTPPPEAQQPTRPHLIGTVELPISTDPRLSGQALTFREGDVTVTRLGAASVQRAGGFDYLRAQFEVKNVGSTPFGNLTLVAVAKQGNVGGTPIKAITDFGGVPSRDQDALMPLVVPTPAVAAAASGALSLVADAADFAALPDAEVAALPSQAGWATVYGPQDTPLNYGFTVSRCGAGACARLLNSGESGTVNVALRVPTSASVGAAYGFLMTFALVNDPVTRVTRSLVPPESAAAAAARLDALGATGGEVLQLEPTAQALPAGRAGQAVPAVRLSRNGANLLTVLTTVQAAPLGTVNLVLNPDDQRVAQDASGTLEFTPGVFTDVDDVQGGFRYVARTFEVRNLSGRALPNVTVRALARPGNAGGTAVVEVRGAPTGSDPQGPLVTDPAFAQAFRPVQRTVLGASRPELDLGGASFQAYRRVESQALSGRAGLGADVTVLDYGFTVGGEAARTLAPGDVTRINVAYRFPRRFGTQPRPFAITLSFVAVTDDGVRVSQAVGESRAQLLDRAQALLSTTQLVQVNATDGTNLPASDGTGLLPMITPDVRVGTQTGLRP
ncbi:hypothetical protein [Deinococcus soli (ex Cha et al. 2016)]|uniref:Lipoprotein n=2 Tax=Deinococcus soli (ex Cha et al. 2016) TaxID=1309411 RepID=A0AAE3XHB2_9DEIO|nr:hypothetical protein [Deinococcus soli (ex Cha et al. 2016)]MDR6220874.1 hypothetical protein [Deinococcus soli (ex Cha et al. 2016)]MDR6330868.1 hypothetical protein [Deinococcus soli (ex Cha et al. 2016)]MDR6753973.1 hypothetical protein [Deinococcus soli (ex Cha et al. 2016)]